ncbi:cytochrome c oxidase assembly protein [Neorickettsia sennetsu]|uniref:Cytochrome c oxidase assembly protein CtaG n=1 Tax=Ehrlichia sennetsu (strain ATCC VR-367 / Miyayama) TaxID=222891 RepID=Q2GEE5_EHRS3|nr:cytochrome c oxidase assembly protein [Neorickettsia sennetsu]ABD46093.1 cytochrome c oxidase assembly protein CtaG [Neorickettsia sennetsu str. Miyayama]
MSGGKRRILLLVLLPVFMLLLSFASVPLYSLFCKATGYAGAVKRSKRSFDLPIGSRDIVVRFNADVTKNLPVRFSVQDYPVVVKPGQNALIFYAVENTTDEPIEAIAVYNVTPYKAAKYFNKVACFCFEKQILPPKKRVVMPVSFFIDPEIEKDPQMDEIKTFTLSYTFFRYAEYSGGWLK